METRSKDRQVTEQTEREVLDTAQQTADGYDDQRDEMPELEDNKAEELAVKTLNEVRRLMYEIESNRATTQDKIERLSENQQVLLERLEEFESQKRQDQIKIADCESRLDIMQDNFNSVVFEVERLRNHLLSGNGNPGYIDKRIEEVRNEYRAHFSGNFTKLITILERLETEVDIMGTDLNSTKGDFNKISQARQRHAQSTPEAKLDTIHNEGQRRVTIGTSTICDEMNDYADSAKRKGRVELGSRQKDSSETSYRSAAAKPIQRPPKFDGKSSWEAFLAQFQIAARMNQWGQEEMASFLATSLQGNAMLVLSNLSVEDRNNYKMLVTALTSRFGLLHQSELARAKLKSRVKGKDESLPELVESVESLARTAYPDASPELQDVLAKDHFIDAMYEEDIRLRIRQARPKTLQAALECALELESFQLASRHRNRWLRGAGAGNVRMVEERPSNKVDTDVKSVGDKESKFDKLEGMIAQLLQEIRKRPQYPPPPRNDRRRSNNDGSRRSPTRGAPRSPIHDNLPRCWTCDQPGHFARDCQERTRLSEQQQRLGNEKGSA